MKYSVLIPVFNSEKTIGSLIDALINLFKNEKLILEIILVNDGSNDNSWEIVKDRALKFPNNIIAIDLMHNHGQHVANYCGLKNSSGDYLITLDDDMQNPIHEIKKLISKSKEGYELVIGKYKDKKHTLIRRLGSRIIRFINSKIFKIPENLYLTNFRIIKRDLVDRLCQADVSYPYLNGLLAQYSKSTTNILVEHHERKFGKSNYSFLKIIKLVFEILFNFSSYPLRIMTIIGLLVSLLSFVMSIFYFFKGLFFGSATPGWTTIIVLLSFISSVILTVLFMLGEYVIRILKNQTNNEKYLVKETLNIRSK